MTKNLRVLPTFLVNGAVAGTWSTERTKRRAALTLTPFSPLPPRASEDLIAEGGRLLQFAERDANAYDVQISRE